VASFEGSIHAYICQSCCAFNAPILNLNCVGLLATASRADANRASGDDDAPQKST
jgi:hypothetical protein